MNHAPFDVPWLSSHFDPRSGTITGFPVVERRLSALRGCFADPAAYEAALRDGDRLVYSVASVDAAQGEGALHYGLGVVHPGRVGDEYFMTKGHLHAKRSAGEFYFGLMGIGMMLLECERTGESRAIPISSGEAVYVPGYAAHRTINTGSLPLAYLGVYPADAGHDYAAIAKKNFRHVVVERFGRPVALERTSLYA
jgi:glucose-6-phosphate isomerase, archaeal